jgi:hypothetical protein
MNSLWEQTITADTASPVCKKDRSRIMRTSNVTMMEFEDACKEFEKVAMPTEADVKAVSEGIIEFACPPPFVENEALIKKDGAYSFIRKQGFQLSVGHRLERV